MRSVLVCVWLLIPGVVAAYHFGPGQERLLVDDAAAQLESAEVQAQAGDWSGAAAAYDAALALLPPGQTEAIRDARIERAKARMQSRRLPEAYDDLTLLMEVLSADPKASPAQVSETRRSLAAAQYYLTWLMRLEGEPRETWEPEIEAARQNYKLLAETAETAGDDQAQQACQKDLEAAIRLARLDLTDLQALPLPSQCKSCNSGKCKCSGKKKGKKPGGEKKPEDARGASSGPPPDGRGS